MKRLLGGDLLRVVYHAVRYWYYSSALKNMHPIHPDYMYVNWKVTESAHIVHGMIDGRE
jgi:hypothetical protein